jgi:hypothetical protein
MNTKARAEALKHPHIDFPKAKDVRGWFQKPSTKELETDAALVVLCSILLGSVFFSLFRAFGAYQCNL